MVTRYDLDGRCDPVEGGSWVDYEDHQAEVTQLQARVAELEAALREYRRLSRILVNSIDDVTACNREADRLLGVE